MSSPRREAAKSWAKTLALTVTLSLLLRAAIVEAFMVPTGSMRPTIQEGDRLLGTKFQYWFRAPRPQEIVVFRAPEGAKSAMTPDVKRLVKRVVAVEGDVIEISAGIVRVNGVALLEPYIAAPPHYSFSLITVPEGNVFVLGDNRNQSLDSHLWGFLPESELVAHVVALYWPPSRIGALS